MRPTTTLLLAAGGASAWAWTPKSLARRQDQQQPQPNWKNDTQNGLIDGPCTGLTVIFARGTREPGNVGEFAGPPFFQALASRVGDGNLTVQGVPYAAVRDGFFSGGDAAGSQTMADLVKNASSKCPDTRIVMSGYSQGGQLVHNAAKILGPQAIVMVRAAVTFGDPYNPKPVPGLPSGDGMIFCHNGDNICEGGDQVLDPHFTYSQDAGKAADFVLSLMNKTIPAVTSLPAVATPTPPPAAPVVMLRHLRD